jgi:hypothetical protein
LLVAPQPCGEAEVFGKVDRIFGIPLKTRRFFALKPLMSAETKSDLRLEIAHVLFIDIVGYSKLLINEQRESLQELRQSYL